MTRFAVARFTVARFAVARFALPARFAFEPGPARPPGRSSTSVTGRPSVNPD